MADLDFYTRKEDMSKYVPDILEIGDEASLLLIQIENLLFTDKAQVLGQHDFGINLHDLLFTLVKNGNEIKNVIMEQIYSYCPLAPKYSVNVDVSFVTDKNRDVALIDIFLNDKRAMGVLI